MIVAFLKVLSTFSSSNSAPKFTSLAEREIKEEAKLVNFGAEYGEEKLEDVFFFSVV